MPKTVVRDNEFIKLFGECVKTLREERKWSVYYLAMTTGIPRNQIHLIEKGIINTNISVIPALCEAFEIDISELINLNYSV
ncbi:MAG: hypothetical protein COA97_08835 [Flavobacteriales bacterium]|nr:MAG: hypothetical protein COA97_08835 [Flavobacteriales bacterium]